MKFTCLILIAAFTYAIITINDAERRADQCHPVQQGVGQ